MPVWLKEKLFLKKLIRIALHNIQPFNSKKFKLLFSDHHLSHAASTFFTSGFYEAAVLTMDGVGEWATASIWKGEGSQLELLKTMEFPHSLGLLYAAFTYWLGFRVNSGEYKVMGLAPYGNLNSSQVKRFIEIIKSNLITIFPDGSLWMDQRFFSYTSGSRMVNDQKWKQLFGFKRREPESKIEQVHCDLALAVQKVTEEVVLKMAGEAKSITGADNICLAGGVALNGAANGKLLESCLFRDIFIQPASGDAGGALGAALAVYYQYFSQQRKVPSAHKDLMQGALLGPQFSDMEIDKQLRKYKAVGHQFEDFEKLCGLVAEKIQAGNIIGWFQGRMEFGPRALGNRSILGNPADQQMQKLLNLKIKKRESFRPFAPAVLGSDASQFFEIAKDAPYMLVICRVVKAVRKSLPDRFHTLPWSKKLEIPLSNLPAVTHVDGSARVQTVSKAVNPAFWQLLSQVKAATGTGVLVNTSFNVRGEPIVCTPEDAYRCFMSTEMDYMVAGNVLFDKQEQPPYIDKLQKSSPQKKKISAKEAMEASLVITAGFLLLWWIYKTDWLILVAFFVAFLSILFPVVSKWMGLFWKTVIQISEWIMPRLILNLFYYLVLTPLAVLYRIFNKDSLDIKPDKSRISTWKNAERKINATDFEKPW
jgi:carbamoyltransferase